MGRLCAIEGVAAGGGAGINARHKSPAVRPGLPLEVGLAYWNVDGMIARKGAVVMRLFLWTFLVTLFVCATGAPGASAQKDASRVEDNVVADLRAAAEVGDAKAQFILGSLYSNGELGAPDVAQALAWFRRAAEQGHVGAQFKLGTMYELGQGAPQDYVQAAAWYRKAADQGDASAQSNLGVMYNNGQGVPQDYVQAAAWYRKAADQGDASAQHNLGVMYYIGQGVPQDYVQAVAWYRKAADQGDASAQYNLGVMYSRGQGVPQNFVQAHKWYNLSAAQETDKEPRELSTKNRDLVAAKMTPAQIAEAQRLAREWRPK
jgi:uncharacterized protein